MKINSFNELMQVAKEISHKRAAVVMAEDPSVLSAVERARNEGIIEAVLFGKEEKIREIAEEAGISLQAYKVVNVPSPQKAASEAVRFVREGRAEIIMKGYIKTADLLRAVLDKDMGLRTGRTLSAVSVFEIPDYDRLIMAAGGGIIINPTLEQKVDMINNCVEVAESLGWEEPLTAIIAGIEVVNPKMPVTIEAAILSKMCDRGQIKGTIVDGPFAIDNAVSAEAARHKQISSPVAGKADILVMPDIEAGNIFYKTLVFLAGAKVAPTLAGAAVPVVFTSRADTEDVRLYSIALSSIYAEKRRV
ncbi:MAG: bifunctional enoyl-CoA hydratase/phosphate acetyltransferase [Candidatus Aerophobetes bacterium]|nr:bifunctional enoyl-CoA hydratase/phosphate acetyltransferase [Candidatus Aerophobetes bacterium]